MNAVLTKLLSDRQGGRVFRCFGPWHFGYLALFGVLFAAMWLQLRKRDCAAGKKVSTALIHAAFGLYVADFFLMPLAYGEIDVEKLPFHACTAMCVMSFLSTHVRALAPWKTRFAMLGLVSNLVYLIYPAGVMWHQVHPLSYRVVQTLVFHGIMTLYGLSALLFEADLSQLRNRRRDLLVIAAMTLWAMLGNTVYNSDARVYNWFFVVGDPFSAIPAHIAPYVMPVVNVLLFFVVEWVLYRVFLAMKSKENCHV